MKREDMRVGMKVRVDLDAKDHGWGVKSPATATIVRPFTTARLEGCSDVRMFDGEERTIHADRIEPEEP